MHPNDLHKWVNEARQGQQTAWNYLYNYYQPSLYAASLTIHGNTAAAKDTVQDSFMIAFLQLHKLKDPLAFPAWIRKILIHNCYRSIRNAKCTAKQTVLLYEDVDISFEKKIDELYNKHKLFESLEKLPESLKATLLLRYFSQYNSYEEIATILCVPVGTIRSRLNKARSVLADHWNKSPGTERISRQSDEWNKLYIWLFEEYMKEPVPRERLVDHLDKDMLLKLTSGKQLKGKNYIVQGMEEDVSHGIEHEMVNSITCGEISVIEFNNINSAEHPDHCPAGTVLVVRRDEQKITQMHLFDTPR